MYSFQGMKPGQIALLASLCAQQDEDNFRQKLLIDRPDHHVGFAFLTGTTGEIKNKLQRSVIGCALKQQIIPRQEIAIFSLCQLSNQALNQALENTLSESHIRIKISLISNSRWIAAAIYGEALIYQRMSQEIMGLSLHRFSPS